MSMRTDRHPCPECGAELDHVTVYFGKPVLPTPGDFSVCSYCATVLIFDVDLKMRPATREDLDRVDNETLTAIRDARIAVQAMRVLRVTRN